MNAPQHEICIQGITHGGRVFRPSDWAERLAGVMSGFRPGGSQAPGAHLTYSEWCVPNTIGEVKCIIVHPDLREHEPMAWDFIMNFAKDNDLLVAPVCRIDGQYQKTVP